MNIEKELYDEIVRLLKKDYTPLVVKEPEQPVLVTSEKMVTILNDLIDKIIEQEEIIYDLQERIEDRERDIEDNYKRIPVSTQVRG